jgi:hypothetical protein
LSTAARWPSKPFHKIKDSEDCTPSTADPSPWAEALTHHPRLYAAVHTHTSVHSGNQ